MPNKVIINSACGCAIFYCNGNDSGELCLCVWWWWPEAWFRKEEEEEEVR
ncbi:hypothetical protein Hanom_Chr03g00211991 [Helianthus anomalus]